MTLECTQCNHQNLIYRAWKGDVVCGWCGQVYRFGQNGGTKPFRFISQNDNFWIIHGKSFLKAIEESGKSQHEIAEITGISQQYISRLTNPGQHDVRTETAEKLIKALI